MLLSKFRNDVAGATYDAIDVDMTHYDALCQFYMYTRATHVL